MLRDISNKSATAKSVISSLRAHGVRFRAMIPPASMADARHTLALRTQRWATNNARSRPGLLLHGALDLGQFVPSRPLRRHRERLLKTGTGHADSPSSPANRASRRCQERWRSRKRPSVRRGGGQAKRRPRGTTLTVRKGRHRRVPLSKKRGDDLGRVAAGLAHAEGFGDLTVKIHDQPVHTKRHGRRKTVACQDSQHAAR